MTSAAKKKTDAHVACAIIGWVDLQGTWVFPCYEHISTVSVISMTEMYRRTDIKDGGHFHLHRVLPFVYKVPPFPAYKNTFCKLCAVCVSCGTSFL
jgi:hypothetical protein